MEWIKDIIIAVVTSFFTIVGVIVGAKMSANAEMRKYRYELKLETYSKIFSDFLLYSQKKDADSFRELAAISEKALLICSKKPEKVIRKLVIEISKENADAMAVSLLLEDLREEVKKELEKG